MAVPVRRLKIVVPIALGALALSHPMWSDSDVAAAIRAADGWWLPLHLLLIAGYAALVRLLWVSSVFARAMLVAFLVCNTAFLAVDGIGVGLLAATDPGEADRLWNSALVSALANLTGAMWAASLLSVAAAQLGEAKTKVVTIGLILTWVLFLASVPPASVLPLLSRLAAAATGAWIVYSRGAAGVPAALLVFAAVLHQHVGAEAALGLLLVAIALAPRPAPG